MGIKVVALVGSYRKGGIVDSIVEEILSSISKKGAQTKKIYLVDAHIEFCTNCRACTQAKGQQWGTCIHKDDMEGIIRDMEMADAFVIGAPVNFYNITAITRRFMERLVCSSYWPWGMGAPKVRKKGKNKKAILVTSSAMPSQLGYIFTGARRALKAIAGIFGARPVMTIFAGMIGINQKQPLPPHIILKAKKAGEKLLEKTSA